MEVEPSFFPSIPRTLIMSIEINNINKYFGPIKVLNNITLKIPSTKMVALLGPSGSGKTTLLRIIAGLENQKNGNIKFHGKDVSNLHARDRHIGFVFQHYALFRHMTVFNNVTFGLKILPRKKRPSSDTIKKKAKKILEMVKLLHLSDRYPFQLSGGQKQRVALARALIVKPQILLLDEPFGALDAKVRKELRQWLRKLHDELKFTSVFVTHDQDEAMEIADSIVIMSQGNIEQVGKPNDVWYKPATKFVLQFLGEVNKFDGEVKGSKFFIGTYYWPLEFTPKYQGKVEIILRPCEIDISRTSNLITPLPVKVIEHNLEHYYYWQVIAKPIGWDTKNLITLTINSCQYKPIYDGELLYIGLKQARLYNGNYLLTN